MGRTSYQMIVVRYRALVDRGQYDIPKRHETDRDRPGTSRLQRFGPGLFVLQTNR